MPKITVSTMVAGTIEKVWQAYITPDDITQWNAASQDWHCPRAEVDLKVGGKFSSRMESKDDSSQGFDFAGTYTKVVPQQMIQYEFGGRYADVTFEPKGSEVLVTVSFDPETIHSHEMQRGGWQAILDNFKNHVSKK
ncbi:MAG: SRPBCC domain-containing protein [Hydrotalea sp.]|nr:SRPBCC domain-containing protein [Hydrotalea sp.]